MLSLNKMKTIATGEKEQLTFWILKEIIHSIGRAFAVYILSFHCKVMTIDFLFLVNFNWSS